jgi:uncharacterized protein YdeI (YjbR/CyaY-like superfamily)
MARREKPTSAKPRARTAQAPKAAAPAPRFFTRPAQWRAWLAKHHTKETFVWVGFWRVSTGKPSLTWPLSVDEALCYGWIDGLRKGLDTERYMIRFSPRKADSIWSAVNMKRFPELEKAGLMTPAGRAAWGRRSEARSRVYAYVTGHVPLDRIRERALRTNARAWAFLEAQTPGYRKLCCTWVMRAKREETRASRFSTLLECCARGVPIPPLKWVKLKSTHG